MGIDEFDVAGGGLTLWGGVFLSAEIVVWVAIGICTDGRKVLLDFVWGSTESYELSRQLLSRLVMALLQAEEGFRKIRHHRDLPKLIKALGGLRPPVAQDCVAASALRAADPTDQTASTPSCARGRRSL